MPFAWFQKEYYRFCICPYEKQVFEQSFVTASLLTLSSKDVTENFVFRCLRFGYQLKVANR